MADEMIKEMNAEALQANLKLLDKRGQQTLEAARQQDPAAAERLEKLEALLTNEDFVNALVNCESAQAAVALFADNGLELTEDQVRGVAAQIAIIAEKLLANGGELSEEDLEQIAGGGGASGGWGGGSGSKGAYGGWGDDATIHYDPTWTSEDTILTVSGGVSGAAGGALIGAMAGTAALPGIGTAVGAVGGFLAGVVGGTGISRAVKWILQSMNRW